MVKKVLISFIIPCCFLIVPQTSFAQKNTNTLWQAFQEGQFSGKIGTYAEFISSKSDNSDTKWGTGYTTIKYETQAWNHLKLGVRVFAHEKLYSKHDDAVNEPYKNDIETKLTLPEAYLSYSYLTNSNITAGRWNHKKISHIDDAQSEGGYVQFKEIKNLEITAGVVARFAEIDYDDGEDFGRTNDAQDLDSENTYGSDSRPVLLFLETKYKLNDLLTINPFYMHQDNYANVIGLDTDIGAEWKKHHIKYGANILYEHVTAKITGSDDANIFAIQPYIKKGPLELRLNYLNFADNAALNHPAWLADSLSLVDQDVVNIADAEIIESRIKYSWKKAWASYAYATATYANSSSKGDGYSDNEFQIGYNITDDLNINFRYFIVQFDNIHNKDYNKLETHLCFKF